MRSFIVFATAFLIAHAAEAKELSRKDRAHLWNACHPVVLGVSFRSKPKDVPGISRQSVETVVRSRLRAARLYLNDPGLRSNPTKAKAGFLSVQVQIENDLVFWNVHFEKVHEDIATKLLGFFRSGWTKSAFGGYGNDGNSILYGLAPAIDAFIDDYLRVNEESCREDKLPGKPVDYDPFAPAKRD